METSTPAPAIAFLAMGARDVASSHRRRRSAFPPADPLLDLGQAQGAFVQGLGYMFTEEVLFDDEGRLPTDGTWEYKPPCSHTIPVDFRVSLNAARRPLTTLPIEHTLALVAGAGPAAFRPDVAVLAQQAIAAGRTGQPAGPADAAAAAAEPALAEQLAKIQVLDSADIAADPELQQQLDEATAAALHSAKTVGEPPVALAVSALLAVKRAVLSARADAGVDGWFELDAPATVARVREACATPRDQLRLARQTARRSAPADQPPRPATRRRHATPTRLRPPRRLR